MNKLRLLLTALTLGACTGAAFAQASVSIGLKGGLNFANVNTTSVSAAYNSRTGYHAGAFVNVKLTKLAIQPEVIYSVQGGDAAAGNLEFGYINIPILLKFYLVGGLNLQAGPQFGFLSSATQGGVDYKSLYESSDMSVALGAGFDIKKFVIDARYNLGLSDVDKQTTEMKNQVFQLSVGFKLFKLGN
ncbi:MAG: PorT family protein [Cyclobacteriaceae bacterium]|nr:PorT family protein [Cyclobacteriaceae bacterium]